MRLAKSKRTSKNFIAKVTPELPSQPFCQVNKQKLMVVRLVVYILNHKVVSGGDGFLWRPEPG